MLSMSAKILVADESPTIHKIVAMAFENEGMTVEGIRRGEQVLEYMVEYQPDLVLADIHLPGTDGYELCRQIKNSLSFGGVRVILLTSDFEDIDQVELEISRADDFISKPFKTEEILKKVKSQLKIPEPEKEARVKEADFPPEPQSNEVIQNEFEDIINQSKESTPDPVKQLFAEDGDPKPSIEEIDLETDAPSKSKIQEFWEEKSRTAEKAGKDKEPPQDDAKLNEVPPEIIADVSAFRAETRPVKVNTGDLNSMFQSVLSAPHSGLEDASKPKPGVKPNLIEETLAFMASQQFVEGSEIFSTPEPVTGETLQQSRESTNHLLGNTIIKEHMDQVMDRLPEDARHGNSHSALEKTVRNVLGEVAPKIIRRVIQEEIENLKKMKEA
jgi:CheY-like chemotaxis protein